MTVKLGVIMDPMESIKPYKDSTFAMLLAAQAKQWSIYYMEVSDLLLKGAQVYGKMKLVTVKDDPDNYFQFAKPVTQALNELDVIIMRKDPPVDATYIACTQLLDFAERAGVLVMNKPQSLRDANEKLFALQFEQCTPPTLVSRDASDIQRFIATHKDTIIKPLDGMGGRSIFRIQQGDTNTNVIIETVTDNGNELVMVQRFIPEIKAGDKRILLIDGQPVPYALARIPSEGENRGNIAAGASTVGVELSDRDNWICEQVSEKCREMGLLFVGLDVIGDYLTEINVTSPTCIRELDKLYGLDIAGQLMDAIEAKLSI